MDRLLSQRDTEVAARFLLKTSGTVAAAVEAVCPDGEACPDADCVAIRSAIAWLDKQRAIC